MDGEETVDNEIAGGTGNVVDIAPYLERGHGRMFKIEEVAPRDETKTHEFSILGQPVNVTYYRNRLTLENDLSSQALARARTMAEQEDTTAEPDSGDVTSMEVALRLEVLVADWDMYGKLRNPNTGDTVVEDGVKIPLDAQIIKCIPLRIIRPLNQAIIDEELGGNEQSKRRR